MTEGPKVDFTELTGLEIIQAMISGTLPRPSITDTMPMTFGEAASGFVKFKATADARHLNPMGGVHGGFAATVLDSVTGCAVHTMLEAGAGYATIDLSVKMLRPIPLGIEVHAEGKVIHMSQNIGVAEGSIRNHEGVLLAHATATCSLKRTRPEVPAAMKFLSALGRLDFDAAAALLDENAVLDLPYVNDGLTIRGRADIMEFFRRSMSHSVSGIVYNLEQAYPSPEAGAIVLEISTQGHTATGHAYTNRLVGIFTFRDGKITLFREYFNSAKIGA